MPPSNAPLVYCETNWIVALAFPHHPHHRLARALRERVSRRECELRLPYAAILEARHPIDEESKRLQDALKILRDQISNIRRNDREHEDFKVATDVLDGDAMRSYTQRPAVQIVDELLADPLVVKLRDTPDPDLMDNLRGILNFRGKDIVDLYLLASIIGDRRSQDPKRPAVFFSTNKKEFEPKRDPNAKVRKDIYEPERLIWRQDFDLEQGVRHWREKFVVEHIMVR